jgi:hypothetical protein
MKKLTEEESKDLIPLRSGRITLVYSELVQLKVGETLIITPKDWITRKPPYATIRRAAKNAGFTFDYGRMPDGSGWVVKRVK